MVFLFKDKSIGSIVALVALSCLVHVHFFLHPPIIKIPEDSGIISFLLKDYLGFVPLVLLPFLYLTIVLIQAIRINLLLNELKMYNANGFTAALSYILLTAILPQWATITAALIANFFVIWIFILLCKLYNAPNPKATLFNIGLGVGGALLCYHPTFILIIVVLFALAVVRPFVLSEWFILLFGIISPLYLFFSILFLTDNMPVLYEMLPHFQLNIPIKNTDIWLWVKMGSILIMLLIGLQYWSGQNNRMVIQIRKNWGVMLVMVLIMLPIPFIYKNGGLDSAILCIVPLSAFIGNAYLYPKKALLPNLLLLLSIILIAHTNWVLGK